MMDRAKHSRPTSEKICRLGVVVKLLVGDEHAGGPLIGPFLLAGFSSLRNAQSFRN